LAGGTATENAIDVYPKHIEPPMVSLRPERVKALTGLDVDSGEMVRILLALGFIGREGMASLNSAGTEAQSARGRALTFIAPTWRVDVEREEDLVEEVARHFGYEKIKTELPASGLAGEYQPSEKKRRALRQALVSNGFDEAISFSFINAEHDGRFELLPNFLQGKEDESSFIALTNPIIEGVTRMRPTLLSGMLDALRHNFNHGTRDVRLFETGRIFAAHAEQEQLPFEREAFALLATGFAAEEGRAGASRELDFYDLKGALEAAVDGMNLKPLSFEAASAKHLREGQSARVLTDEGQTIGTIGRLADEVAALYKFRQPVYIAEVDLSVLLEMPERPVLYRPLARYPSVVRDVSLLVDRRVTLAEMLDAIRQEGIEYCRDAQLVDVYEGAKLPEDKRSVTLRVEYRADDRTLRDEEVDEMHARIVQALERRFKAQLRG
ncbi:MAG TPA: phenylalanine--tRNA ligase subunit beta, partial [Pyrinomonadaceae bacterium]